MKTSIFIMILLSWTFYINDFYLMVIPSTNLKLLWTLDLIFFTLIPLTTMIYFYKKKIITLNHIPLNMPFKIKYIYLGLGLCGLFYILDYLFIGNILNRVFPERLFNGYSFPSPEPIRLITVIYASLSAGILEELIFRGVIVTELNKHIKNTTLLVISASLIFALIHWGQGFGKIIDVFIFSIVPTLWFIKTKQLWGNIIFHTTYNFIIFI